MAAKKPKVVVRRRKESVRERAEKVSARSSLEPRRRRVASAAAKPVRGAHRVLKRQFHPIKLPNNKVGRHLTKSRSWVPGFLGGAWQELKKVTWLKPKQALSLSFAVVLFSTVIAGFVRALDYGLEKLFREVFLK